MDINTFSFANLMLIVFATGITAYLVYLWKVASGVPPGMGQPCLKSL